MVREVGVLSFKTNLSALLTSVERGGDEIAITRRGKVVAHLLPPPSSPEEAPAPKMSRAEISAAFKRLRDEIADRYGEATDFDIKAAIEEGRE